MTRGLATFFPQRLLAYMTGREHLFTTLSEKSLKLTKSSLEVIDTFAFHRATLW